MEAHDYYQARVKQILDLGNSAYPHKYHVSVSLYEFIERYSHLENGASIEDQVSVAGRVMNKRVQSKALVFYDLHGGSDGSLKLQIMAHKQHYANEEAFHQINHIINRGDIIGVKGIPHRSNRGELSLMPQEIVLLSPCFHMLPRPVRDSVNATLDNATLDNATLDNVTETIVNKKCRYQQCYFDDKESRYRQRYLDLILNPQSRKTIITRSKIISFLRHYLEDLGFLEIETPILNMIAGGAIAKPFKTFHNELSTDMYLRIAPELPLKMAVIGGLDRVFEIGKQFRNEGIDLTHNPEFTTCEFYWTYQDYDDLMTVTEDLLYKMVLRLNNGNPQVKYGSQEIDFTPPYPRVSMIKTLEEKLEVTLKTPFDSEDCCQQLMELCRRHNINCHPPHTTARLLDYLVGHFLEKDCSNPTFIIDHPLIMSPLAKTHRSSPELTERFELFIAGKEVCNAYTELNSPLVQRERFAQQQKAKESSGDAEIPLTDEDFCKALEYGLPPTAGWGMGIDRLTMFLTDQINIKEVILYPTMKEQRIT